jgi:hypothetical protein
MSTRGRRRVGRAAGAIEVAGGLREACPVLAVSLPRETGLG